MTAAVVGVFVLDNGKFGKLVSACACVLCADAL